MCDVARGKPDQGQGEKQRRLQRRTGGQLRSSQSVSPVSRTAGQPVDVHRTTHSMQLSEPVHVISYITVLAKNARLHSPERLMELLGELSTCEWDVVPFSEIPRVSATCKWEGSHVSHSSFLGDNRCGNVFPRTIGM